MRDFPTVYLFIETLGPEGSKCSNACPRLLCFSMLNNVVGKDHLVSRFISDVVKLTHVLYYKQYE